MNVIQEKVSEMGIKEGIPSCPPITEASETSVDYILFRLIAALNTFKRNTNDIEQQICFACRLVDLGFCLGHFINADIEKYLLASFELEENDRTNKMREMILNDQAASRGVFN